MNKFNDTDKEKIYSYSQFMASVLKLIGLIMVFYTIFHFNRSLGLALIGLYLMWWGANIKEKIKKL